jgi:citrate synthase
VGEDSFPDWASRSAGGVVEESEKEEVMVSERKATLSIAGEPPVHFPLIAPTHGRDCLDIRTLGARTGRFAYDSGFESTASCQSKITFIDGEKGELLHHGYPIEQLAEQCDFLDVAYLLKHGELANAGQKEAFESAIRKHAPVHEQMVKFYQGFRRDADPMAVMVGVVGALSAFHHEAADFSDAAQRNLSFHRIVARMPTIVAMAYKYSIGEPFMRPRADLGYAANFLHMMFATPREEFRPNPVLVRALDSLFIVFADQGQDASTSTVRMAGSSGANPFACVSAAIACLSGPAHSGTSEACLAMLQEIGDSSRLGGFVARARDACDGFVFRGFGHPVYRRFDPRAQLLREVCDEVLQELGLEQHRLFALAKALEKLSLEDPYFVDRELYPSVDFYSAIVQKALGIPMSMFACILALARTAGWMAQWEEMLGDPEYRIARPRQLYTGVDRRQLPVASPC